MRSVIYMYVLQCIRVQSGQLLLRLDTVLCLCRLVLVDGVEWCGRWKYRYGLPGQLFSIPLEVERVWSRKLESHLLGGWCWIFPGRGRHFPARKGKLGQNAVSQKKCHVWATRLSSKNGVETIITLPSLPNWDTLPGSDPQFHTENDGSVAEE